jgi:glutamate synthase domain-containing protein 3
LVSILELNDSDELKLKEILKNHILHTNSKYVDGILKNFNRKDFIKVLPNDYAKIMEFIELAKKNGSLNPELDAFNKFMEVR